MKRIIPVFLFVIFGVARCDSRAATASPSAPFSFARRGSRRVPSTASMLGQSPIQNLELKLYDPGAKNIATYAQNPPPGSRPSDWGGPSCIQSAGFNQNPPPTQVPQGSPTDPPNLWTGVCMTPVACHAARREQLRRSHWPGENPMGDESLWFSHRSSGDQACGWDVAHRRPRGRAGVHELDSASRGRILDCLGPLVRPRHLESRDARVLGRKPDLSRVDEVGFADVTPGSRTRLGRVRQRREDWRSTAIRSSAERALSNR